MLREGYAGCKQQHNPRPASRGVMRQSQTIHVAWHLDVGEQHMNAGRTSLQRRKRILGVAGLDYLETFFPQGLGSHNAGQLVIFGEDNNDLSGHSINFEGGSTRTHLRSLQLPQPSCL